MQLSDHQNDHHAQEMLDELVSKLASNNLTEAHNGIADILTEVNRNKDETSVNDDLEPENEFLRVYPEDLVEYVSRDEWAEIVRQHDEQVLD